MRLAGKRITNFPVPDPASLFRKVHGARFSIFTAEIAVSTIHIHLFITKFIYGTTHFNGACEYQITCLDLISRSCLHFFVKITNGIKFNFAAIMEGENFKALQLGHFSLHARRKALINLRLSVSRLNLDIQNHLHLAEIISAVIRRKFDFIHILQFSLRIILYRKRTASGRDSRTTRNNGCNHGSTTNRKD